MEAILEAYRRSILNWLGGLNYSIAYENYESSGYPNEVGRYELEVTIHGSDAKQIQFASFTVGPYDGRTLSTYMALGLGFSNGSGSLAISEGDRKCKSAGINLAFIFFTGRDMPKTSIAGEFYRNDCTNDPKVFFNYIIDTLNRANSIITEVKKKGCE